MIALKLLLSLYKPQNGFAYHLSLCYIFGVHEAHYVTGPNYSYVRFTIAPKCKRLHFCMLESNQSIGYLIIE